MHQLYTVNLEYVQVPQDMKLNINEIENILNFS